MALDLYAPCPCGSGKKIKFCCSHDIVSDLDKIARSLEGEQRIAAIEQIDRVMAAKGKRAALLCLKASVQIMMNDVDKAEKTVDDLLEVAPSNPAGLAQASILASLKGNLDAAVDNSQRALESSVEVLPPELYQAIDLLARQFVSAGNVMAARAHLMLLMGMSEEERERPAQAFISLNNSSQIPLLLKQDFALSEAPTDMPWEEEFDAVLDQADRQAWQSASEKLVSLAGRVPPHPAILKNIAILRSWLGDIPVATAAWHAYAEQENVPLDDAVEAEALAQLLDPDSYQDKLDQLRVTYQVQDTDKLMERLLSDRRAARMPIDPAELADGEQPPPKAVFWFLDRPAPLSGATIVRDEVPNVIGELAVYGRQTDREARLEFIVVRTAEFARHTAALADLVGDLVKPGAQEEVLDQVSAVGEAITWRWRFPDDTPDVLRESLVAEKRRETLFSAWPKLPLSVLDGKNAEQAAKDESYHVRLLAAILLLELAGHQNRWELDFNELRRNLGLPTREPIDAAGRDISRFSVLRLSLIVPQTLSDEELVRAMSRSAMHGEHVATKKFATELLQRPSLHGQQPIVYAYELLAGTAVHPEEAVEFLQKGREAAEAQKISPAPLMLNELQFQFARGAMNDAVRLVDQLQKRHIREPGVAQRLFQILVRYGILSPDGTPRGGRPEEPSLVGAGAPAGGLWTPDSERPAPAAGEQKSKLWLPGMD